MVAINCGFLATALLADGCYQWAIVRMYWQIGAIKLRFTRCLILLIVIKLQFSATMCWGMVATNLRPLFTVQAFTEYDLLTVLLVTEQAHTEYDLFTVVLFTVQAFTEHDLLTVLLFTVTAYTEHDLFTLICEWWRSIAVSWLPPC